MGTRHKKVQHKQKELKQILRNVELYFAKIWHQIDISTNLWQIFIFETDIRSISLQAKFEIALILDEIGKTEAENQLGIEEKKHLKAIYWCLHCIIVNVKVAWIFLDEI